MRNEDQTEEAIYELLGDLAGVETWDVNLRDHPQAYAAVEKFLASQRTREMREAADRAVEAWDNTVLPKAHDGMMQERMEDLRATLNNGPFYSVLAECRDAFPVPERGSDLEHLWAQAMGDPYSVPGYIKAAVLALSGQSAPGKGDADTARLDWLEKECGSNLINDDAGRWQVSTSGFQPVPPEGGFTEDVSITSIAFHEDWKPTIREAIDAAMSPLDRMQQSDEKRGEEEEVVIVRSGNFPEGWT